MYAAFVKLINMSITAGILALIVMIIRLCLKKTPKKFICLLWGIIALRLICPISFSSTASILNVLPAKTDTAGQVEYVQYNGHSEKPQLVIERPGLVNDELSPNSMTIGTRTSKLWLPLVMYVWVAGFAVMIISALISYYRLKKKVSASLRGEDGAFTCDEIDTPFVLGVIRPRIYILSGLSKETRKYVIAHERAHIRRHDHWWKPLGYVLLSINWFNPILWIAYIMLCKDIESACDERVIARMTSESIAGYSEALLFCAVRQRTVTACPVAFGETNAKGRVIRVLKYKKPAAWIGCIAICACIVAAVCLLTDPIKGASNDAEGMEIKDYSGIYETQDVAQWLADQGIEAENTYDTEYVVTDGETISGHKVALRFSNNNGLGPSYSREFTGSISADQGFVMDFYSCLIKQYGYGQAMDENTLFKVDAASDWDTFYKGLTDVMKQWDVSFEFDEETGYMYQNVTITWYKEHVVLLVHVSPENDWVSIRLMNLSPQAWDKSIYAAR